MIGIFTGNSYRMAFHPHYRRNAQHIDNCIRRPEICITVRCQTLPYVHQRVDFMASGFFVFPVFCFRGHTPLQVQGFDDRSLVPQMRGDDAVLIQIEV